VPLPRGHATAEMCAGAYPFGLAGNGSSSSAARPKCPCERSLATELASETRSTDSMAAAVGASAAVEVTGNDQQDGCGR
jgi:hypothetical protein